MLPGRARGFADLDQAGAPRIDPEAVSPAIAQDVCGIDIDRLVVGRMHDLNRNRPFALTHFFPHFPYDGNDRAVARFLVETVAHCSGFFRVGDAGHRRARGDPVGVRDQHGDNHAGARRQAGDVDAVRVDRVVLANLIDDLPQILDLARTGVNLAVEPPAPAILVSHAAVTGDDANKIWLNDGSGSLALGSGFGSPYKYRDIALGDLDGDGAQTVEDVLFMLANFGHIGPHPADIDLDDLVGTKDLLILLGIYGCQCL